MFVIAGCGATENAQIVGVPPAAQFAFGAASTDRAIAAFQQALNDQLNQALGISGASGPDLAAEANALANDASLITAERIDALKALGAQTAGNLEKTVKSLIAAAAHDSNLGSVSVDGHGVGQTLRALLNGTEGQLEALGSKIAADTLVDALRTDVSALAAIRVYGLVDPQAHLLTAAGDALFQADGLAQTSQQLWNQISSGANSDPSYSVEVGLSNQVQAAVNDAESTAVSAVRQLLSLTADGYPANRTTLTAERQVLTQLSSSTGPIFTALHGIDQIKYLLSQRA